MLSDLCRIDHRSLMVHVTHSFRIQPRASGGRRGKSDDACRKRYGEIPGRNVWSALHLDAQTAVRMMERLYDDSSFSPVWEVLADFVTTPRRHLVFVP